MSVCIRVHPRSQFLFGLQGSRAMSAAYQSARLRELALLFLRLGATAFGGPAAHIAMMEDEVVRRRGWLTRAEFLDLLGATNLIPGPNSTEMAIHRAAPRRMGRARGGRRLLHPPRGPAGRRPRLGLRALRPP